jgi:mRNA deadenylase 3'-5' endonuclease subunit Ccr4
MMLSYDPGLQPGLVKYVAQQRDKSQEENEKLKKSLKKPQEEGEKIPQHEGLELIKAADEFRFLGIWAEGFEGTIDYLFEYLNNGTIRNP